MAKDQSENRFDCTREEVSLKKAEFPWECECLQPHTTKIPETPGESATNTTLPDSYDDSPPWKNKHPAGLKE